MSGKDKKPGKTPKRRARPRPRGPQEGSLAWYRQEWTRMASERMTRHDIPSALIEGLAQLSYENRQMRKRMDAMEAIMVAQMFGKVEIQGVLHLMECRKRQDPKEACTCGSLPDDASATGRN